MTTIKLYANLRNLAGSKELLSITGKSLRDVLIELEKQFPALAGVILENGVLRQHNVISINGHHATDLNTPVIEDDMIAIFPPIAGGWS